MLTSDEKALALADRFYSAALGADTAEVALQVAHGQTAESIAAARGIVVGTVRAQIKRLLAKLGVKRQVELVARLSQL